MSEQRKPEPIDVIEKRYPNEWLAIEVTKLDRNKVPLEGVLLFHSPDRKEVRQRLRGRREHVLFTFSGDIVPADMEVLLSGDIAF